ncbi:hypothetical protein MIND_00136700 [Mycena indigotica]|uniref:Uncharacterized protein n=1 Tax=Mycena indigotica TaxID=2126181 RepID=A0A8H6TET2_9AGAR|nr:uncharacterized protein MIND_00136700 [Mycena indigotica]KAF7316185.1 hypothetical protein MIND_00136700 [Mycena indigotica]
MPLSRVREEFCPGTKHRGNMDDMLNDGTPIFGGDGILEAATPPTRLPSPALSTIPNYHAINRWPSRKFNARRNTHVDVQNLEAQSETSLQEERGVVRKAKDDPDWNNIGVQWKNRRRLDENGDCVSATNQEINAKIQNKSSLGNSTPRMASRLDTVNFMSPGLTTVFASKEPYLHSPVDDFYAHFYVAQWAAVFHPTTGTFKGEKLDALRTQLSTNNSRDGVKTMVTTLCVAPADIENFGGFLCTCASLFELWDAKIRKLWREYRIAFREVDHVENNEELKRSLFMAYASRGVADYMAVLAEWTKTNPTESDCGRQSLVA